MTKQETNITKEKEIIKFTNEEMGVNVRGFIDKNGIPMFNVEDIARGVKGRYVQQKNNKEYIRFINIKTDLEKFNFPIESGKDFISESAMYLLIMNGDGELSRKFQYWIATEVLPSIRKHGAYISDDEDSVNNDYIRFTYGQLKKTFSECPIENLLDTYNECMLWHKVNKTRIPYAKNSKKRKDATHTVNESKIMIMEKINKVLDDRAIALCSNNKFGLVSEINNVRLQIKDDIKKQNNLSSRGKLGQANAKIKKLQDELEELPSIKQELELAKMNIDINNYEVIDLHAMSCNYLFKYDSSFGTIKTSTYRKWINDFSRLFEENQLATKDDWEFYYDIDFSKPICIYIKYVAKSEFDIENFNKATIDMLFNRLFGVDDNIVHKVVSERLAVCDTYADGKIMYYIENI